MIFNSLISTKQTSGLEVLWENPDPTVNFASQVISLPTGYSAFIIEFKQTPTSRGGLTSVYVPFSTSYRFINPFGTTFSAGWAPFGRYIDSAIDGAIDFGYGCFGSNSSDSLTRNDAWAIPTTIYGLKFTV